MSRALSYQNTRDALSRMGIRATYRAMESDNFSLGVTGWKFTAEGTIYGYSAVFAGGTIGGFTIGSDYIRDTADSFGFASTVTGGDDVRFWAGATYANRATAPARITEGGIIYATGAVIDGTSTLGGRLASTLASAINATGNFIDANLDTFSKTILSDFAFSPSDYAGAFKTGTITWNTTTGAITGGTGIVMNKNGIVGALAGVTKFSITTAGVATFAGSLSAPTGTLGTITTALITFDTTGYLRGGMTDYETGTGFFLGYHSTAYKFSLGIGGANYGNMHFDGADLWVNGTKLLFNNIYGDGSSGDTTISANTSLSADALYDDLTIAAGYTLNTNGFRLFVKGILTIEATAAITAGSSSGDAGSIGYGFQGGTGGAINANGGNAASTGFGVLGVVGGHGAASATQTGGNAGSGSAPLAREGSYRAYPQCITLRSFWDNVYIYGGMGGGGGAGSTTTTGGAGGAGGGMLVIVARTIINNGAIRANGSNGSNGADATAGGGGGGGGGYVVLVYNSYSGSGTKTATGGAGGTGYATGSAGSNGTVVELQM